jgi:uncharacterized protein (TIGR02646 family)
VIKIAKPATAPDILLSTGKTRRASLCSLYSRYSDDYESGTRKFTFDGRVYGHDSVKATLVSAQHRKCCYCESRIGFEGDIEHYRPKAGCCQAKGEPVTKPEYYWLAYEWNNLLLSCKVCNQTFKQNSFPLVDPTRRAKSHKDDISQEDPLLINPAESNPELHIAFRQEIAYPIDDNPLGTATILTLGLNRPNLTELRLQRLQELARLHALIALEGKDQTPGLQDLINSAKAKLDQAVADSAEFASMSRCAAKTHFRSDF